jgi:hypothetical protein
MLINELGKAGLVRENLKRALLSTPSGAVQYAQYVLHGKCEEAEPIIKTDEGQSYIYAISVLRIRDQEKSMGWGEEVWGPLKQKQNDEWDAEWELRRRT